MTTPAANQLPAHTTEEDLATLERLSLRILTAMEGADVSDDEINRLIDEDRRARHQERLAKQNGHTGRRRRA